MHDLNARAPVVDGDHWSTLLPLLLFAAVFVRVRLGRPDDMLASMRSSSPGRLTEALMEHVGWGETHMEKLRLRTVQTRSEECARVDRGRASSESRSRIKHQDWGTPRIEIAGAKSDTRD